MPQRLPMDVAQVNACNTYVDLLNEIHQIKCFCIEQKQLRKKYIKM